MGALPKSFKPQKLTAKLRRFHIWVMDSFNCMGCGAYTNDFHHPLMESPLQQGRRDHEFGVPVCRSCHTEIHAVYGDEEKWAESKGCKLPIRVAEDIRLQAKAEGWL